MPPGLAETWWPASSAPTGTWVEVCGPMTWTRCPWWLSMGYLATQAGGPKIWLDHNFHPLVEQPTYWRLFRGFPDGREPM